MPAIRPVLMLRLAFAVAPIALSLDEFFNVKVDWPKYLAPWVNELMPGGAQDFRCLVGGVESLAGVLVALKPRYGAPLVAAWLAGIIVNLLTFSGWYDVALRDNEAVCARSSGSRRPATCAIAWLRSPAGGGLQLPF
jgi:hypothetical protein